VSGKWWYRTIIIHLRLRTTYKKLNKLVAAQVIEATEVEEDLKADI